MSTKRTTVVVILAAGILIGGTGCTAEEQPTEETAPAPAATYGADAGGAPEGGDSAGAPSREGQAVGSYEPLVVPDGIPVGVTDETTPDLWTIGMGDRRSIELGDTAIIHVDQSLVEHAEQSMTVAIAVDDVTEPVSGAERDNVLTDLGYNPEHQIVLQKITMRVRIVQQAEPTSENELGFNLADILDVKSDVGGDMPFHFYPEGVNGGGECVGSWEPMNGHDASTGDTVQVCGYVTGDLNTDPMMWVYGVQLESTWAGKYRHNAMIMSDAWNPKTHTEVGE